MQSNSRVFVPGLLVMGWGGQRVAPEMGEVKRAFTSFPLLCPPTGTVTSIMLLLLFEPHVKDDLCEKKKKPKN